MFETRDVKTRPPAVASMFYPGNPEELSAVVREMLEQAEKTDDLSQTSSSKGPASSSLKLRALIVPHAGYVYSGTTAAKAFHLLTMSGRRYSRVFVLGPAHRVWLRGVAVPGVEAFDTPLGRIELDRSILLDLADRWDFVEVRDDAHAEEHCLEVQLPFLQHTLKEFLLVPMVVGDMNAEQIADFLEDYMDADENLIVISTDLSHFHDYETACSLDRHTAESIERHDLSAIEPESACGAYPLRGLLSLAERHRWVINRLGLCNSGDTAGSRDRVVGYGAWSVCG